MTGTDTDYANWMSNDLDRLGGHTLSGLVLPGSHDSGMTLESDASARCTAFGHNANTRTQRKSIADQLAAGCRYFDFRPFYTGDMKLFPYDQSHLYLAHFGRPADNLLSQQGCVGEKFVDAMTAVNNFLSTHNELVIVKIGHFDARDVTVYRGAGSHVFPVTERRDFPQTQFRATLKNLLTPHGYRLPAYEKPLTGITLKEFLTDSSGAKRGVVLAFLDGMHDSECASLPGAFGYSDYQPNTRDDSTIRVYDQYSDTNDYEKMQSDQHNKMANASYHGGAMYLLSWTLTQSGEQATTASSTILDLADWANGKLAGWISDRLDDGSLNGDTVPNVILVDDFDTFATDVALDLGLRFNFIPKETYDATEPANRLSELEIGGKLTPGQRIFSPEYDNFLEYDAVGNLTFYSNAKGRPAKLYKIVPAPDGIDADHLELNINGYLEGYGTKSGETSPSLYYRSEYLGPDGQYLNAFNQVEIRDTYGSTTHVFPPCDDRQYSLQFCLSAVSVLQQGEKLYSQNHRIVLCLQGECDVELWNANDHNNPRRIWAPSPQDHTYTNRLYSSENYFSLENAGSLNGSLLLRQMAAHVWQTPPLATLDGFKEGPTGNPMLWITNDGHLLLGYSGTFDGTNVSCRWVKAFPDGDILLPGQRALKPGEKLVSQHANVSLNFEKDGSLILQNGEFKITLAEKVASGADCGTFQMHSDGSARIVCADGTVRFDTHTTQPPSNAGRYFCVGDGLCFVADFNGHIRRIVPNP